MILSTVSIDFFSTRQTVFLFIMELFEDHISKFRQEALMANIEDYSSIVNQFVDIGFSIQLKECSYPKMPQI